MIEGFPGGIEGGSGSTEGWISPDKRLARKIEVGPELGDSYLEQGPANTDTTFTWAGKEYTVSIEAVAVNSNIFVDNSEMQDQSSWLGLKVVEVTNDQPPRIKTLRKNGVRLQPAGVKTMIKNGFAYQAFIKA